MKISLANPAAASGRGRVRDSRSVGYAFALLCSAGAAWAWTAMAAPLADPTPYQVLLPFVALAAWFGGVGPGLAATLLVTVWALTHGVAASLSLAQELELALFVPLGAFIAALCGGWQRASARAQQSAQRLAQSQNLYQSIVETAAEGIWMTDRDFKTTFINGRMAQLLGVSPDAMLGRDMRDFLFPEDRVIPARNVAAHSGAACYETEGRYRGADGRELWFRVNVSLLRDADGQISDLVALHTDITQRRSDDAALRQSHAALRQSHERFELAMRAVAGYVYEWDLASGNTWRSSGFGEVLGFDPQRTPATQDWWQEQIHPDDAPGVARAFESILRGESQFSLEYRFCHADNTYHWLWDRGVVVRENGRVKVVASVSDISARKEMEEALRDSEADFRQLADAMPPIVWVSDVNGVPEYFNRRWYDYSGQPVGTVGAGSWGRFYHPDDWPRICEVWRDCAARKVPYLAQARIRDKNGDYRWFLCRSNPSHDENGQITRWFGTATDIDDQKRAADAQGFLAEVGALLNSSLDPQITFEQITRLAVPALGDWCFAILKNSAGQPEVVASAHQNAAELERFWERYRRFGLDASAPRGFSAVLRTGQSELVPQITPELWAQVVSEDYATAAREAKHHSLLVVPLQSGGRVLGCLGFTYAQSERSFGATDLALAQELARRASIALENARLYRELQDAARGKDEFLAMLAHELRNPLAAIAGARRLLDDLLKGEAKLITNVPRAILERQSVHLARLVDDLLDVSRITRGRIELRRQQLDFATVIEGAVESARPLITGRRHQLRVEIEAARVDADPARLGQIVSNLLNNAAKYTDPGGQISVTLRREANEAVLRVRDNGTGLKPEMLGSIWDLFVQSDRTLDRAQGGLGIGLTLVKSLAEMHGGRVEARSEGLGQGSEFIVALPLLESAQLPPGTPSQPQDKAPQTEPSATEQAVAEQAEAGQIAAADKAEVRETQRADKNRVLVVDDNQDAALMLGRWLETKGYDVQLAHDGAQGLILACGWQPDVALLDIGMPALDGYEVARRLRALPQSRALKLIAITGYGQQADHDRALAAGFDFHLTKPVNVEELHALIKGSGSG